MDKERITYPCLEPCFDFNNLLVFAFKIMKKKKITPSRIKEYYCIHYLYFDFYQYYNYNTKKKCPILF